MFYLTRQSSFHCLEYSEVLGLLYSRLGKLEEREADKRLASYGMNLLVAKKGPSVLVMFIAQFKDLMTVILLMATLISGLLGEYADALTIIAIVILNSALGLFHELRAERAMQALKKLEVPSVSLLRST
ncbi:MAG: Calcium-transporting ATPase [Firmicutes bacterium]|nr:Calcium-transporting ATPase [Bacillota bacterium]